MNKYKLSILIPTLYSRLNKFTTCVENLMKQIRAENLTESIEIIAHFDNKSIGLSKKRTDMLKNAQGDFIAFLDDDDKISDNYIKLIYEKIINNPTTDVITFHQQCDVDGNQFMVVSDIQYDLKLNNSNIAGCFIRFPWIWCVWRRSLVAAIPFKDMYADKKNFGEDAIWLEALRSRVKTETKNKSYSTLLYI